jgi:uncharacterized membrane protein (UPF0127 family)
MLYKNTRDKKNIIVHNLKVCDNIFNQGTGLMFRTRNAVNDKAWIFTFSKPRIIAITMMFVFFPIDLIFLDDKKKVIEVKEKIAPWAFYTPKNKATYCIELKAGIVQSKKIRLNDKMIF